MPLAPRLLSVADSEALLAVITEAGETVQLPPKDAVQLQENARTKLAGLRALATLLSDPEDEEDLYRSLAALWLELRFEWERYNQVTNYQLAKRGQPDGLDLAMGSAVSAMLTHLELLLGPASLGILAEHAIALLDRVRPDVVGGTPAER